MLRILAGRDPVGVTVFQVRLPFPGEQGGAQGGQVQVGLAPKEVRTAAKRVLRKAGESAHGVREVTVKAPPPLINGDGLGRRGPEGKGRPAKEIVRQIGTVIQFYRATGFVWNVAKDMKQSRGFC